MNKFSQLLCAHSALLYAALLSIGIFGVAGWLPLVSPSASAAEVAQRFVEHSTRIRVGMTILALASVFWWSFAAAISMQMRRVEGAFHPLSWVQFGAASGAVVVVLIASYLWLALAYRPGSLAPETLQLVNDYAWLTFIGAYPPGLLQNLAIGVCVLSDKSKTPVFPRWVGFANLWLAVAFMPGALLPFFHSGPFAWNGIIGFWLVAFAFFGWIIMMWWATVRAIHQQAQSESAA